MTNEELVKLIQNGIDVKENTGLLYQQNKGYIYKIAQSYSIKGDIDELMQEAYFGLNEAIKKYNFDKDVKFITYLSYWIKQSISRYIYKNSKGCTIPINTVVMMSKYHKYTNTYMLLNNGEKPRKKDYMIHLGLKESAYNTLIKAIEVNKCVSLSTLVTGTDNLALIDTLTDDICIDDEVVERVGTEQAKKVLWDCVACLDTKQRYVIESYYKYNINLKDIAEKDNVTSESIRQIKVKALRNLRNDYRITKLGIIYGCGYQEHKTSNRYTLARFKRTFTSSTEYEALKHIEEHEKQLELIRKVFNNE